ncbi:hypothetical protein Y032_0016g3078 [Ancylostoma ceylanicum]|uniref:Uncharacterized protein n=1 Tax=Ancylostoma ceylanicum TaxID=53326 RepID=A0A016V7P5_9BILA|nr:hypothetical protein Y032_0016g3078 [Ancylostoma ceylanicum]
MSTTITLLNCSTVPNPSTAVSDRHRNVGGTRRANENIFQRVDILVKKAWFFHTRSEGLLQRHSKGESSPRGKLLESTRNMQRGTKNVPCHGDGTPLKALRPLFSSFDVLLADYCITYEIPLCS